MTFIEYLRICLPAPTDDAVIDNFAYTCLIHRREADKIVTAMGNVDKRTQSVKLLDVAEQPTSSAYYNSASATAKRLSLAEKRMLADELHADIEVPATPLAPIEYAKQAVQKLTPAEFQELINDERRTVREQLSAQVPNFPALPSLCNVNGMRLTDVFDSLLDDGIDLWGALRSDVDARPFSTEETVHCRAARAIATWFNLHDIVLAKTDYVSVTDLARKLPVAAQKELIVELLEGFPIE